VRHRKRIIRAPIVNILYLWRNLKKVLENELAYYRITCKTCAPIVLSPKYDGWHDRCGSFHSVWLPLERWNAGARTVRTAALCGVCHYNCSLIGI
jgi:hypothetical protein